MTARIGLHQTPATQPRETGVRHCPRCQRGFGTSYAGPCIDPGCGCRGHRDARLAALKAELARESEASS